MLSGTRKNKLLKILLVTTLLLVVLPCLMMISISSVSAAYLYSFKVYAYNSTAADITTRVLFTVNASDWVGNGFCQPDAEDVYSSGTNVMATNMGSATAKWYLGTITVPASGQTMKTVSICDTSATRDQHFVSATGDSVSVPHDATLSITDEITLKADVYLDSLPGAEKEIISKQGNYELAADATDFIFRVWKDGAPTTENLTPNAAGFATALTPSAGNNWDCVNDAPPLGVGADADYVTRVGGFTNSTDYYNLTSPAVLVEGSTITSVTVYYRAIRVAAGGTATPLLRLGSDVTTGTPVDPGAAYSDHNELLARPGGGGWTYADLVSLQVGINLATVDASNTSCSQIYAQVAYTPPDAGYEAKIADAAGSWITLTATYSNGTGNMILTNGTLTDTTALVGALHTNTEPVQLTESPGEFDTIKIGGTSIAAPTYVANFEFEADEISSTTITDLTASTNDATMTLVGNTAGITVSLTSMVSTGQPPVTTGATTTTEDILPDVGVSDWYKDVDTGPLASNPFRPFVVVMSDTTTVTESQAWMYLGLIAVIFVTVAAAVAVRGHLLVAGVACSAVIAMLAVWTIWPWWTLVFILPAIVSGLISERTPSV